MKYLFVIAFCCLGAFASEDSIAMESEVNYHKVKRFHPEDETRIEGYHVSPGKKFIRGKYEKARRNLIHREREARGQEESWVPYHKHELKGPVYELPQGFEIDGKYFEEQKQGYQQTHEQHEEHIPYVAPREQEKKNEETLNHESSQHPGVTSGSYLNHIKEQMSEGKLLGYSSFVEHFSENDDAEELKTAMREGSLEDIKKLVPKSSVSFQMYHGGDEQKVYKTQPIAERKPEASWNEINEWHQPSPSPWPSAPTHYVKAVPHKTYVVQERKKKKLRKHPELYRPTYHYQLEESRDEIQTTPVPDPQPPKIITNEVYEKESYPQIIPSISYEIPSQSYKGEPEYEIVSPGVTQEQDSQESKENYNKYVYNSEQSTWTPVGERPTASQAASEQHRVITTPKPPEAAKLYYEHFKNTKETSKYSQLPTVGHVIETTKYSQLPTIESSQQIQETHYIKKPLRLKPTGQTFIKRPVLASGEDFNQKYAQIPTTNQPRAVTPQPAKYWSKPDKVNHQRSPTPVKLEKILNKQTESKTLEKPAKEGTGNIFLTKQFQTEISDYFNGGKSDLEWVPSTQIRYDSRASTPVSQRVNPENTETPPKPKKYRIYRSERNPGIPGPKNIVFLGPESQQSPGSFSVTASYQIDKNRRSDQ